MISQRAFMIFSYFVLITMAVSLALMAMGVLNKQLALAVFAVMLVLYLLRIALRLILARQQRVAEKEKNAGAVDGPPQGGS